MQTKSLLIATALAATTLAGAATEASAGHHFHHRHFFFSVGPTFHDCTYEREMWYETGLFKWKRRYFICKGWW